MPGVAPRSVLLIAVRGDDGDAARRNIAPPLVRVVPDLAAAPKIVLAATVEVGDPHAICGAPRATCISDDFCRGRGRANSHRNSRNGQMQAE